MRIIAAVAIIAVLFVLASCTAEKAAPEQPAKAGEAVAEPAVEQVESDLNTTLLDEMESELDVMFVK